MWQDKNTIEDKIWRNPGLGPYGTQAGHQAVREQAWAEMDSTSDRYRRWARRALGLDATGKPA